MIQQFQFSLCKSPIWGTSRNSSQIFCSNLDSLQAQLLPRYSVGSPFLRTSPFFLFLFSPFLKRLSYTFIRNFKERECRNCLTPWYLKVSLLSPTTDTWLNKEFCEMKWIVCFISEYGRQKSAVFYASVFSLLCKVTGKLCTHVSMLPGCPNHRWIAVLLEVSRCPHLEFFIWAVLFL